MTPIEILKLLEAKTGITPLNFSPDGVASFIFNDRYTTHLEKSKDDQNITIYGVIGPLPTEGSELCLRALLNANLFGRETAGGSFGMDHEKDEIILSRIFTLENLQPDHFLEDYKQFLLAQEHWTKCLETKAYETFPGISREKGEKTPLFGSNFLKL